MKKYTLLLASVTLFSFVSTVTATDYESDVILEDSGYESNSSGQLGEPTDCAFQFTSYDGDISCISGKPSGWNRPKSDYWHHETNYIVTDSSKI